MRIRTTKVCGAVALALTASGCGTLYKLDVTAFESDVAEPGKTYVLLPATSELQQDKAEFNEYADQLEVVMAEKGYTRIADGDWKTASLGVYLSADIGEPTRVFEAITRPIFSQSSSAEPAEVQGRNAAASGAVAGGARPPAPMTSGATRGDLEGVQKTGHTRTVHTKHLNLQAIDLQKYLADIEANGQERAVPQEIWSVDVKTTGTPSDLSEVVPVMIIAGEDYISENTGRTVQGSISETDRRIDELTRK